jgi:hypothetical protein
MITEKDGVKTYSFFLAAAHSFNALLNGYYQAKDFGCSGLNSNMLSQSIWLVACNGLRKINSMRDFAEKLIDSSTANHYIPNGSSSLSATA